MIVRGIKHEAVSQGAEPMPGWVVVTNLEMDAVPFVMSSSLSGFFILKVFFCTLSLIRQRDTETVGKTVAKIISHEKGPFKEQI